LERVKAASHAGQADVRCVVPRATLRPSPPACTVATAAVADVGRGRHSKENRMHSVAKVSELSARSDRSFEDAIEVGIARASKTLRRIVSVWIKEQHVEVDNGKITGYRVNMLVTFVLED
jgi:flavin-binding protein dodecin